MKDIPFNEDDEDAFEDSEDDLDEGVGEDLTTGKAMFIFTINTFNDQKETIIIKIVTFITIILDTNREQRRNR